MVDKRPALGRGLSALIPDVPAAAAADRALEVDTDLLRPNKFQPRTTMDEARIEDLARSIRSHGIIQPIVVRRVEPRERSGVALPASERAGEFEGRQPLDTNTEYEIIAGERRWRAAQQVGLLKVPVVVRDIPEDRLLAVALIENIQRENLNPLEEAHAYRRLTDEFQLTQEQIADAVGKDRSSIANYVRLLRLPQEIRANVASGALSMGHARALLGLTDEAAQRDIARLVVASGLSVREAEALVRKAATPRPEKAEAVKDVHTRAAEEKLRLALGTRVRIVRKGKAGRVEIDFTNEDELQRIYEYLTEP
ncbi:MAG TPA: ParB/RepB/Spo0J family partition protein [Vicinamibacterales bacterium]|nr:ParB/RepB/Spo0J family partition protein [Vicinamibacterales bacterium]